jgi:hypothetical protein
VGGRVDGYGLDSLEAFASIKEHVLQVSCPKDILDVKGSIKMGILGKD